MEKHLKDVPTPLKSSREKLLAIKLVIEPSKLRCNDQAKVKQFLAIVETSIFYYLSTQQLNLIRKMIKDRYTYVDRPRVKANIEAVEPASVKTFKGGSRFLCKWYLEKFWN